MHFDGAGECRRVSIGGVDVLEVIRAKTVRA